MYPSLDYRRPGEEQFLFPRTGSDVCLLRSFLDDTTLFLTSPHKFSAPDHVPECGTGVLCLFLEIYLT